VKYFLFHLFLTLLYSYSGDDKNGNSKLCILFPKCGDLFRSDCDEGWCEGQTGLGTPLTIKSFKAFKDYPNENGETFSIK
jgi:hypothetical protein